MEDIKVSLVDLIKTKTQQKVVDLKPTHDELNNRDTILVTFENGTKAYATMQLKLQANGKLE